ncbi:MAG TPA: hypothetical protein VFM70_10445 [Salinimicrobium sp.]|nr:hypothetical protein [Salinimicrobium sp.]
MTRIVKRSNFFRRNFFLLFGGCLFLLFILMLISDPDFDFWSAGYLPIGVLHIYMHFYNKKKYGTDEAYIAWDDEKIVVRELQQPPNIYTWSEVDDIRISKNHLTIKSGAANGIMMDLKGFKEEDIPQLENELKSKLAV